MAKAQWGLVGLFIKSRRIFDLEELEQEITDNHRKPQEIKQSLPEEQIQIKRLQRSPEGALQGSINETNVLTAAIFLLDDTVTVHRVTIDHLQTRIIELEVELLVSRDTYHKEKDESDRQLKRLQEELNDSERKRKRSQEEIVEQALLEIDKGKESLRKEDDSPTGQLASTSEVQSPPLPSADRTHFLPGSSQAPAQDMPDSDHIQAPLTAEPNHQPPPTEIDFCFLLDGKKPDQAGDITGPKSELLPAILEAVQHAFAEWGRKRPNLVSRPYKSPSCIGVRADSSRGSKFKDGPGACCHMCRRKRTPCIIADKGLTPMFILLPLVPKHRDKKATQRDIGVYIQPLDP